TARNLLDRDGSTALVHSAPQRTTAPAHAGALDRVMRAAAAQRTTTGVPGTATRARKVICALSTRTQPCEAAVPSGVARLAPPRPWMPPTPGPPPKVSNTGEKAVMASTYGP